MEKYVKECYRIAKKEFDIKEDYDNKKTNIDFIEMTRQHFRTNIKNHIIIYCNKPTDISDIKIDLEAHLYLNKDCKESNSNNLYMSIITVIFSIIGSGILANDKIETSERIIGAFLMVAVIIFLGALIDQLTNWLGSYLTNSSLCYKQILDILTEVEKEKLQY